MVVTSLCHRGRGKRGIHVILSICNLQCAAGRVLGRFLALISPDDVHAVGRGAGICVRELDRFRAPASEAELAQVGLNPSQEAVLVQRGYPYVAAEFGFHMTLAARLPQGDIAVWSDAVRRHLPDVPSLFVLHQIALCGEREGGRFEVIHRYNLIG
ncbi:MAG: DUF1045 domain-containing protein [Roseobacter sp.]